MACVTLKRSLEFDPVHSPGARSPKRRRCMPICMPPSTPTSKCHEPSPFGEVTPKLTPGTASLSAFTLYVWSEGALFNHCLCLLTEQILANVREEVKRLQRRKQLQFYSQPNNNQHPQDTLMCESPGSPSSLSSCPRSPSPFTAASLNLPGGSSTKDKPLFTFKQVQVFVCLPIPLTWGGVFLW